MDDCSSDNSKEIIEEYRFNNKISHIVYNDINSGSTFKQWEKGIDLAFGDLIWIAESDDWCESNFLSILVQAFSENDRIVLGYVQSYCIDVNDNIKYISIEKNLNVITNGISFINEKMIFRNCIINASMAIFKKSTFLKISKNYTSFKFCGDWLFWIELATHGDVYISGKILNYFRKHDQDVSGKNYLNGNNFIEELNVLYQLYDHKIIEKQLFYNSILLRYNNYRSIRKTLTKQMKYDIDTLFLSNSRTIIFKNKLKIYSMIYTFKFSIIKKAKKYFFNDINSSQKNNTLA